MLNIIWSSVRTNVVALSEWWDRVPNAYRGGGCMLLALFLIWEATKASGEKERDRKFFFSGLIALLLLAYGAMVFVNGNGSTK